MFAWSEATKPRVLWQRATGGSHLRSVMEREPLFCMETAIKMLYFSGMAYEHDEVGGATGMPTAVCRRRGSSSCLEALPCSSLRTDAAYKGWAQAASGTAAQLCQQEQIISSHRLPTGQTRGTATLPRGCHKVLRPP